jgi:hypothetical protein
MKRRAPSVIADVKPMSNTAAAASLNFDSGFFADTDCLTCSTGGGGAGISTDVLVDFSQNPELPAPTAGFAGGGVAGALDCGADTGAGDAWGVDAGEADDGDAGFEVGIGV